MTEPTDNKKVPAVEVVWNILKEDMVFVSIVTKTFIPQTPTNEELKEQFCKHPTMYIGLARQQGFDKVALKKYIKLIFKDSIQRLLEKQCRNILVK
jgi:hypothetical protein